jgi:hypothetical protein
MSTAPQQSQKTQGNNTADLLNDLGEEMAHVNRQLRVALESLRMMQGFMVLTFFATALRAVPEKSGWLGFGFVVILTLLLLGVIQWFATKRIK